MQIPKPTRSCSRQSEARSGQTGSGKNRDPFASRWRGCSSPGQLGQRVQPSTPLLSVVPVQQIHVNANFKEVQLQHVKVGQKVELVSDLYGDSVPFHGTVEGFDGGTGAAFSIIPAQNATGNWIKVVQRLPVRIKLNADELAAHPLRVGLSMKATVNLKSE